MLSKLGKNAEINMEPMRMNTLARVAIYFGSLNS